MTEKDTWAIMV